MKIETGDSQMYCFYFKERSNESPFILNLNIRSERKEIKSIWENKIDFNLKRNK